MNKIKLAFSLLPVLGVLNECGVLDIMPDKFDPYVQLTEDAFLKLFPKTTQDENGYLVTYLDGVKILAVHRV